MRTSAPSAVTSSKFTPKLTPNSATSSMSRQSATPPLPPSVSSVTNHRNNIVIALVIYYEGDV